MNALESLRSAIAASFDRRERPPDVDLIVWDGYDQLDKEQALRFYSGKTWCDVLDHLRGLENAKIYRGAYFLEEWSVLSPAALAYHSRGHLEFLLETLASDEPDEEYVFHFLCQVGQLIHMYKRSPFSIGETAMLRTIVEHIAAQCRESFAFEYFGADIEAEALKLLSEPSLQRTPRG